MEPAAFGGNAAMQAFAFLSKEQQQGPPSDAVV
jgi:hypothetical protein